MRVKVILVLLLVLAFSMAANLPSYSIGVKLTYGDSLLVDQVLLSARSLARSGERGSELALPRLQESIEMLSCTEMGKLLVSYLCDSRASIRFGNPETPGVAAVFVPGSPAFEVGEIVVSSEYSGQSPRILAAIIAHEISHLISYDPYQDYSLEQELHAYLVQAAIWRQLRKEFKSSIGPLSLEIFESSPENDYALQISELNVNEALCRIKSDYKRLQIDAI